MNNEEERKDGTIVKISTGLFDKVETYRNCTVQILTNSVTGEVSIGWWENDNPPVDYS